MTTQPTAWPALDAKLLADAAETFNFRLGHPGVLAILPDGAVLFRRTGGRSFTNDLFELAPDGTVKTLATAAELLGTGEEKLSNEEKAKRERTRTATRGVVDISVSEDGRHVLVPLGGAFYLIDRTTNARTRIDPGGAAFDPRLSPDGTKVAFVRDGKLVIGKLAGAKLAITVTTKPPADHEDATADFAAQEELDRTRGFWWSPDSKQVVFQRTDNRPIDSIYVADARHPEAAPVRFKYPRAGTHNAKLQLGVIDADKGGEPRWLPWDAKFEYLVSVQWSKNAPLTTLVIDRDQQHLALVAYDGKLAPRTLLTESDDAWLNVDVGAPLWLQDGTGFVWMTEASGVWELELHGTDGKLVRKLAREPGAEIHDLIAVDATSAIVTAAADPTRQFAYRVPLDGGPAQRIGDADGWTTVGSKHGITVVDTALATGGKRTVVVDAAGKARDLPSAAEKPSLVPTTVLETVTIGDRVHHTAITRPRAFDPKHRYPVLLKVYAGPHATTVKAVRDDYVMDQWYADAGFVVVRSDNRGTPFRGRTWERAILKDLITVPMDDQVAALQAMGAAHPEMDLTRVGVVGWSFGGYFSTMAVLMRPDVFKAAVAGAPVTDWALYDTAYTERYMKTPQQNADGYARGNAVLLAEKLARPLLLIHGITDDNVHFAHTLAFIEALFVAAKRAEVITLSGTHMVPDPKLNLAREKVQVEFFRQHLGQ